MSQTEPVVTAEKVREALRYVIDPELGIIRRLRPGTEEVIMPSRWTVIAMAVAMAIAPVSLADLAPLDAQSPSADARQRVVLPPPARDKILAEMRGLLESLQGVLRALAANDQAAAEKAARGSGMGVAADVQPEVRRLLPQPFLQLGMQTHRSFDALADKIKAGGKREETLQALADLTGNCVACHAAYRLDDAR